MTYHSNKEIAVSVEVSAAEVIQGIFEINGTISYQEGVIEFAYQTTNMLRKDSEKISIRVPLDDLQKIEYKSSVVSTKIVLFPKRLSVMAEMPGAQSAKMIFHVKRKDRQEADEFVSIIKNKLYELSEIGLGSVPFLLKETNMGITENSGLLYLDEEFLIFDLQSGLAGVTKGESQIIKIEPRAITAVRFERGGLKDALYIKPKTDALLSAIPGGYTMEVKLKIAKQDRQAAEQLVSRLRHRLRTQ